MYNCTLQYRAGVARLVLWPGLKEVHCTPVYSSPATCSVEKGGCDRSLGCGDLVKCGDTVGMWLCAVWVLLCVGWRGVVGEATVEEASVETEEADVPLDTVGVSMLFLDALASLVLMIETD